MTNRMASVAVAMGILFAASAVTPGIAKGSNASRPATQVKTDLNAVPWGMVGPGWLVATWEPHPRARPVATYLVLVSPDGRRFPLYRLPGRLPLVVGWSGDGRLVLLQVENPHAETFQIERYEVVNLRTGSVVASFRPGGAVEPDLVGFTTPDGLALVAANEDAAGASWLERYSLSGVPELRYPNSFAGVGSWGGSWLETPDGTQLIMGASDGLAIVDNDGSVVETLSFHHPRQAGCSPEAIWGPNIILASCFVQGPQGPSTLLYEFSSRWPKPRRLTAFSGMWSFAEAWRIDHQVIVQMDGPCGPPTLGQLTGHRVSQFQPPEPGSVLGTTATSLALTWVVGSDCGGGSLAVKWWTPSTNSSRQVLGPPVFGGQASSAVAYPTPDDVGGPYGF